jgi:eukaryotic-like serine/threonine-protein kinase
MGGVITMSDSTSGPDLFNRLADEFAERYRRGERPTLSEYAEKQPELAEQINELFPALVAIEQFGSGADQATGLNAPRPGAAGPIPERLGDYRILREIARGGMGIVYEAVQESLGRHVALKVMPQYRLHDRNQLERFQREARAAAMLHHTNIVPVYGVGEHNGVHHYAMQYIEGQSLDAVLREVRRLRGVKTAEPAPSSVPGGDRALAASVAIELVSGRFAGQNEGPAETVSVPASRPPPAAKGSTTRLEAGPGASSSASSIAGRSGSP